MTLSDTGPTLTVRHTGQVFSLGRAPVTIGSQEECTIVLADPEVSPLHAIISWQAGAHQVVDAGSAGGTYLDERRLRGARPLRSGSVLRVGRTLFDVQSPARDGRALPRQEAEHSAGGNAGAAAGQEMPAQEAGPAPEIGVDALGYAQERVGEDAVSRQPAEWEAPAAQAAKRRRRPSTGLIVGLIAGAFVAVCLLAAAVFFLLDPKRGGANVSLKSPKENAQVAMGEPILLQANATGARDITRLELSVDGAAVGSTDSADAGGQSSLTAELSWTFDRAGPHTVTATAYTAGDGKGKSVTHQVTVVDGSGTGTPSPTPEATGTPTSTPTPTGTQTPTPTPTPTGTPEALPVPLIEFFRVEPETIDAGQCATLQWGQASYAVAATISNGIGGVATPGSLEVCPTETTRYVMTASGPGGVSSLELILEVTLGHPDLVVDGVIFSPYPPVQGQETQVQIQVRNAGDAAAGAFAWEWRAGSSNPFTGRMERGLGPGESAVAGLTWTPEGAFTELLTLARLDTGNEVAESDEGNNEATQTIPVVAPGATLVLRGEAGLDGTVTGGQAAFPEGEIRVGNDGEAVDRGFLSFDLRAIPSGVSITDVGLRFYQLEFAGRPYQKLGRLMLTLVDYGPSLDVADFDLVGLGPLPLGKQNQPGSWYEIEGTQIGPWLELARDAGLERLQFRLQFEAESDGDGDADYIRVEAGDNSLGTGNVPELTIAYSW